MQLAPADDQALRIPTWQLTSRKDEEIEETAKENVEKVDVTSAKSRLGAFTEISLQSGISLKDFI